MSVRERAAEAHVGTRLSSGPGAARDSIFSGTLAGAFVFSLILNLVLYPTILLFIASPMFARSWTLQDPSVSAYSFVPGLEVVRYELLHNGNMLWTALKNFGAPILANEVQAAPMFPLTLALIWVPGLYFWNAFVSLRLVLLAMGTFLVGTRLLKCSPLAAIAFTLMFAYSTYVCRWINHPIENGLAAGVWVIYFAGRELQSAAEPWSRRRFFNALGLAASVYALITCGFPEATAMSACLAVLVIGPMILRLALQDFRAAALCLAVISFAIVSAALLAGAQIFALAESVSLAGHDFRNQQGLGQFSSFAVLLDMIERYDLFPRAGPGYAFLHTFGLVPLVLFAAGLATRLARPRNFRLPDAVAILLIAFYVVKAFPVWPAFNALIASIPVLRQSWFPLYFFPLLLLGFAYFGAKGLEFYASAIAERRWTALFGVTAIACPGVFILGLWWGPKFAEINRLDILLLSNATLAVFVLSLIAACWLASRREPRKVAFAFSAAVIALLVGDYYIQKPLLFVGLSHPENQQRDLTKSVGRSIVDAAQRHGLSKFDIRESSGSGSYVGAGVATIDNGASAILTPRALLLRAKVLDADWDGLLPFKGERVKDGYRIAGRTVIAGTNEAARDGIVSWGESHRTSIRHDTLSPGRAFVAARCHAASDPPAALDIIGGNGFRLGDVVVEDLSEAELAACRQYRQPSWTAVPVVDDRGASVRLTTVQGPAFLTLNDSFYPGWTARDRTDGQDLPIRPANVNFRAVYLAEARSYDIEFSYRPYWLAAVLPMMLVAAAAWIGLAAFTAFRGRIGHPSRRSLRSLLRMRSECVASISALCKSPHPEVRPRP